ncbi:unnamed protein product [Aspergillus oryzae]|uniref:Unnamed protein product n=2 Tax=Aspergillus oryzae TaxID=5062 RepID=A0AAN5BWN7_ASPOZ|nr:unnamed protein product [Aspergillus oryzae]GMF89283.1 unnamed protein product [Aspergillus oryzae]GMG03054.1 unnamed protein product [Aspergillus oryzae]GMG28314.1 unnamed protein product [Aspergillus oryzae]GMG50883.1 unnamed protein product [Aspergillus oryzae var. brunneus]
MRSSPSCNRIAASRLVKSCQSVRGKINNIDPETYRILEHTRALYAARLAICELNGAGTHIPNACLPVTFPPPQKKGIFGFSLKSETPVNGVDPVPVQLLESCLKSLESRPQWWTSYSNSRQNAFVICQAARTENEKEELLNLHRSVVEGSNKLNQGLQEALRTAAAESLHHRAFVSEISNMNARLVHDMEETRSHFKAMIEKAFYEIESRAVSIVNTVTSVLGRVQAGVTNLDKVLKRLQALDTSLKEFQLRAESLHKSQLQQSEAVEFQSRLQEKLQTSVQISQALLDKAAATAANLQAMIDETSARYKDTPALRPLFSTSFSWTFFGLLLSLIASHNVKFALAMLIISARKYQYPQLMSCN